MEVTLNNYDESIVPKMIEKLIQLIEYKESVKIDYKIKKIGN